MSASDKVPLEFAARIAGDTEVASRVRGMGGALGNFGQQAESAGQKTEAFTGSSVKLTTRLKDSALGISTAASAATSLVFQYGNLEKASQRVEKAEVTRLSAEASLTSAQATLNAMVEKGVTAGDRYEAAVLRVESSQARLKTSTKDVELAQGDLSQQQTQFALSVVPTVLGSVSALSSGLKGFSFSAISAKFHTLGFAQSNLVLAPALGGTAVASTGAAAGMRGFALASRTAQIAMGPVGWILLGVGAALTLVATNAFGVRDAIDDFAETVVETIPILKPFVDAIGAIGNAFLGTGDAAADMQTGMHPVFEDGKADIDAYIAKGAEMGVRMPSAAALAKSGMIQNLQTAGLSFEDLVLQISTSADEIERQFGRISKAGQTMSASFSVEAGKIRRLTEEEVRRRENERARIPVTFTGRAPEFTNPFSSMPGPFMTGGGTSASRDGSLFPNPGERLSDFAERMNARTARHGIDEVLTQDTAIFAHAGEHVSVAPPGTGSSRNNGQKIIVEAHLHLDGREIAHSVSKRLAGALT